MSDHALAIWALVLTIVNAAVVLLQYIRTATRRVKIRYIQASSQFSIYDAQAGRPDGDTIFEVDVLSVGAAIWDMKVRTEAFLPAVFENGKPPRAGTHWNLSLSPVKEINPLNSGQAMKFIIRRSDLARHKVGTETNYYQRTAEEIKKAPLRYMSLAVYGAGGRDLLKRVRGRKIQWAMQSFFQVRIGAKPSLGGALNTWLLKFPHGKWGGRIRRWMEKRKPGSFDMLYHRISKIGSETNVE
jgi:hypothetical protein